MGVPGFSRPLAPGSRLDRYELLFPLAEGGMAQVWVARLPSKHGLGTLFAIKVLSSRLSHDPGARAMLFDEARIAARIRHPNVAQIVELGEQQDTPFLVLEWVDGESLSMLARTAAAAGRPFSTAIGLSVLAHAAAGLHAAHELTDDHGEALRVVHRDVSPQNILVGASGEVKLIDFGIAKAARRLGETTTQGTIKGKVQYMAPEQIGDGEVDRRVDVWGLGAVLYHLLAGSAPYAGHDELSTLRLLLMREPPPRLEGFDPAILQILDKTLAPDPNHRFATADELSHALEEAARREGGLATPREIGRYVDELVGPRLSQRRALLKKLTEHGIATASADRKEETKTAPTELLSGDDATGATNAQTLPALYPRRRSAKGSSFRWVIAAALSAIAGLAALLLLQNRGSHEVKTSATPSAAPASVETELKPSVVVPVDEPSPSASVALPAPAPAPAPTSRNWRPHTKPASTKPAPKPTATAAKTPGLLDAIKSPK